jgi:FMN phosphatase YigB (HAD superfamily)
VDILATLGQNPRMTHVFVDVFDTGLLRTTTPELERYRQWAGWAHQALVASGIEPLPTPRSLYVARVMAWRAAYATAPLCEGCREPSLTAIFQLMVRTLRLGEKATEMLHEAEIAYEKTQLRANEPLIAQLQACQRQGIKVIFVSDMFLSKVDIEALCHHCAPYFTWDGGYVSCESGLSKRGNGKLFDYVMTQERCKAEQILHLGDSRHSDYDSPRSKGIAALHTPRPLWWQVVLKMRLALFLLRLRLSGLEARR